MRARRFAAAVVLISTGSVSLPVAAHAATATTIYVNNTSSQCSDGSGGGSQATPFCTIPGALGVVQPGQTVMIEGGSYAPFTVSVSGTAAAPITITNPLGTSTRNPSVFIQSTSTVPAITLSGASYVNVNGLTTGNPGPGSAAVITGSHHVSLDRDELGTQVPGLPAVEVTGGSSAVTISRDLISADTTAPEIEVHGGSTGTVVTTSQWSNFKGPGIAVDDAPGTAVTGNTIGRSCGLAVGVTGGSTGTSVENNLIPNVSGNPVIAACPVAATAAVSILVDDASTAGTTIDYDNVYPNGHTIEYSWSGATYNTSADFHAATSQGAHDLDTATVTEPGMLGGTALSIIDSADADAPGELSTDIAGQPRVDDPAVTDRGTGTHTYYDRGSTETEQRATSQLLTQNSSKAPIGGAVTFTGTVSDGWGGAVSCEFDFGDGSSATVATTLSSPNTLVGVCSAQHPYKAVGTYAVTLTSTTSYGLVAMSSPHSVNVVTPTPLTPVLTVVPQGTTGVSTYGAGTISAWDISGYSLDYGDGTTITAVDVKTHAYAKPGTYKISLTATNVAGETATASQNFTTTGQYYSPLTPTRILDTRDGTGVAAAGAVPANGVVRLKVAGAGPVPATGVAAVALNLTVTAPAAGGYITAYPDGGAQPVASNLNFTAGQTTANLVIVQVGPDGYIDLKNTSGGGTHLIADVAGYYGDTATDGYQTVAPARLLDTRKSHTTVPAHGTARVYVGGFSGAVAVTMNLTVTNPTSRGYITAYPSGTTAPDTSNVNYTAHQTVPNEVVAEVGADGYVDLTNTSTGSVDLIADVTGYFTVGSGMAFVPMTPTRFLDTRTGLGAPAGPVQPGGTVNLRIDGTPTLGLLFNLAAVTANVTVTRPTGNGYITAYPYDEPARPTTSLLNYVAGQTVANATTLSLGTALEWGGIKLYNGSNGTTHLIVDVFGYYNPLGFRGRVGLEVRQAAAAVRSKPTGNPSRSAVVAEDVHHELHDAAAAVVQVDAARTRATQRSNATRQRFLRARYRQRI